MPVTFGSVGDIISVSILVKDLIAALDNAQGAASEYQSLIRELSSLDRALLQVDILSRSFESSIEMNALCATAQQTVENCRSSMNSFLQGIRKYETSLRTGGSGSLAVDVTRDAKWICSGGHDRSVKLWGTNDVEGL
jgi:hypothetical protein